MIDGGTGDGVLPLHVSAILLDIATLGVCQCCRVDVSRLVGLAVATVVAQIDTTAPTPHTVLPADVVHGTELPVVSPTVLSAFWVASRSLVLCWWLACAVSHGLHHVLHLSRQRALAFYHGLELWVAC